MNIDLNDININSIKIIDEHAVPIDDEVKIKFNYKEKIMYMRNLDDKTTDKGEWKTFSNGEIKTYSNIDTLEKRVLKSNLSDDDKITIIKIIGQQGYRPIDIWYDNPPRINGDGSGGFKPPYEVYCNGEEVLNERC